MWTRLHLSKIIEIVVFEYVILPCQWQLLLDHAKEDSLEVQHESNSAGHRVANLTNLASPRLLDTNYL